MERSRIYLSFQQRHIGSLKTPRFPQIIEIVGWVALNNQTHEKLRGLLLLLNLCGNLVKVRTVTTLLITKCRPYDRQDKLISLLNQAS